MLTGNVNKRRDWQTVTGFGRCSHTMTENFSSICKFLIQKVVVPKSKNFNVSKKTFFRIIAFKILGGWIGFEPVSFIHRRFTLMNPTGSTLTMFQYRIKSESRKSLLCLLEMIFKKSKIYDIKKFRKKQKS